MVHNIGQHHYHKRKGHLKLTSPRARKIIDYGVYAVTVFGLVMTIPQLWNVWFLKNATGVSAASWIGYTIIAVFWLIYGIAHKVKPIIISNMFWILLDILIVVGTIIHG